MKTKIAKNKFRIIQLRQDGSNEETLNWQKMSPAKRFAESQKLWSVFMLLGGNYEPEPDSQSPFNIFKARS